jgi:hypothetical protein
MVTFQEDQERSASPDEGFDELQEESFENKEQVPFADDPSDKKRQERRR